MPTVTCDVTPDTLTDISAPTMSVVICTKDRPEELATCLRSLAAQTRLPLEVVIVEASATQSTIAFDEFRMRVGAACPARLIGAEPGLTRQRNVGVRAAAGDVVLFLDDDVVLEPGYVAAISDVYARDAAGAIGGVGGAIVPDPTPRISALQRALRRIFLLPSWGRGRIKRSGYPEYALSPAEERTVEFLSGCNMSFRREVLERLRFDERLSGYAAGEDIQFSYRASRRWRLVLTPHARLEHREVGGGRPVSSARAEMGIFHHYLFFREDVAHTPLDWACYAWAWIGLVLFALASPSRERLTGLRRGLRRVLLYRPASDDSATA